VFSQVGAATPAALLPVDQAFGGISSSATVRVREHNPSVFETKFSWANSSLIAADRLLHSGRHWPDFAKKLIPKRSSNYPPQSFDEFRSAPKRDCFFKQQQAQCQRR
jgi:hypothetical protein